MRAIALKSALGADDVQYANFQAVTGIATEKRRRRQERFSVDHKSPSDASRNRLVAKCRPVFTNAFASHGRKTGYQSADMEQAIE
jgi:hypothetical protein